MLLLTAELWRFAFRWRGVYAHWSGSELQIRPPHPIPSHLIPTRRLTCTGIKHAVFAFPLRESDVGWLWVFLDWARRLLSWGAQRAKHFLFLLTVRPSACLRVSPAGCWPICIYTASKINWAATGWKMGAPTISESGGRRCSLFVLLLLAFMQIVRAASTTQQQQSTLKHPLVVLMLDGYVCFFTPLDERCKKWTAEY